MQKHSLPCILSLNPCVMSIKHTILLYSISSSSLCIHSRKLCVWICIMSFHEMAHAIYNALSLPVQSISGSLLVSYSQISKTVFYNTRINVVSFSKILSVTSQWSVNLEFSLQTTAVIVIILKLLTSFWSPKLPIMMFQKERSARIARRQLVKTLTMIGKERVTCSL